MKLPVRQQWMNYCIDVSSKQKRNENQSHAVTELKLQKRRKKTKKTNIK